MGGVSFPAVDVHEQLFGAGGSWKLDWVYGCIFYSLNKKMSSWPVIREVNENTRDVNMFAVFVPTC